LLDAGSVVGYLVGRGVLREGRAVEVETLGGGVSNVVLGVRGYERDVVVKQALPKLRVAEEWYAPEERSGVEAAALVLAGELTPGVVPRVVDRDPQRHSLTVERAPRGWSDWKRLLLGGGPQPWVAERLGEVLATWHMGTLAQGTLPAELEGILHFEHLRLNPYYATVAARAPELAPDVLGLAEQLRQRRICFVHGDFSPKNVLVGAGALWVVDFEVAHRGDPAFDVAFMICHLVLKSVHIPKCAERLDTCTFAFAQAYEAGAGGVPEFSWPYVLSHVACLLLARVRGKSPVEYLSERGQQVAWSLGVSLLREPPGSLTELFELRDRASSK
jgi:tRNA A-37 threonylcarbamoyl transferase component Bud32